MKRSVPILEPNLCRWNELSGASHHQKHRTKVFALVVPWMYHSIPGDCNRADRTYIQLRKFQNDLKNKTEAAHHCNAAKSRRRGLLFLMNETSYNARYAKVREEKKGCFFGFPHSGPACACAQVCTVLFAQIAIFRVLHSFFVFAIHLRFRLIRFCLIHIWPVVRRTFSSSNVHRLAARFGCGILTTSVLCAGVISIVS